MTGLIVAAVMALAAMIEAAHGVGRPEIVPTLMAVSWYESNWDAGAVGDHGCSLGYFQLNQCGGMGRSYTAAELLDGQHEANLVAQYLAVHLAAGYEMQDILSPWSVRWPALRLAERVGENANGIDWALAVMQ